MGGAATEKTADEEEKELRDAFRARIILKNKRFFFGNTIKIKIFVVTGI